MNESQNRYAGSTGDPDLDQAVRDLVGRADAGDVSALCEEMIITALRLARDGTPAADMKLFNRSLKEMRHAAGVFRGYGARRKVAVFGSARTAPEEPEFVIAERFARLLRERGFMIITGAGDGIMGAAQRGAGRDHSFGLNIRLPFEQHANETIRGDAKLINFNYFFTRKLNFLKESHAVALFPGGFGTMDEGFETLTLMQTGKARIMPLVLVDRPQGHYWSSWLHFLEEFLLKYGLISPDDFNLFKVTDDVDEAVEEILQFYRNYHSYRWVGERMVIRLLRPLSEESLRQINAAFSGDLEGGEIVQCDALPEEDGEPNLLPLKRIVLSPKRQNFGRLRLLIDTINASPTVEGAVSVEVPPDAEI